MTYGELARECRLRKSCKYCPVTYECLNVKDELQQIIPENLPYTEDIDWETLKEKEIEE